MVFLQQHSLEKGTFFKVKDISKQFGKYLNYMTTVLEVFKEQTLHLCYVIRYQRPLFMCNIRKAIPNYNTCQARTLM